MAADLYSDTNEGDPVESPSYGGDDSQESEGTALLPKSFFPEPPKPGKTCSVRVVSVQDDQVEVEYAHDESADDAGEQAEMAGMAGGGGAAPNDYMS